MYHSRGRRSRGPVGTVEKVWIVLVLAVVALVVWMVVEGAPGGIPVGW